MDAEHPAATHRSRGLARAAAGVRAAIHALFVALAAIGLVGAVAAFAHALPLTLRTFGDPGLVQILVERVLVAAIAGELALLLLLHRTRQAVETVILVLARKMLDPDLGATQLAVLAVALAAVVAVRMIAAAPRRTR